MTVAGVRVAASSDLEEVAVLARDLRLEMEGIRGGLLWAARDALAEPIVESLRALLDRDDARVVVGTGRDAVVGFAIAVVETLRDGARLGRISALYVAPGARRAGVGENLLASLFDWCAERGCLGVDAPALPGHRAAKSFFEHAGFVARALVMHRPAAAGS